MRLLDVTTNTDGAVFDIHIDDRSEGGYATVQVQITGTATVVVQGRAAPDLGWVDIKSYTASGSDKIALFRQMRAISSGMSSATAKVELDAGPGPAGF